MSLQTPETPPAELSAIHNGLSQVETAKRLAAEGYNELPRSRNRTFTAIALEVVSEPMFELLIAAAAIYLLLGELPEALMLGGSAIVTIVIAIFQENRTERVLESLQDLASPRALVVRDGVIRRIPGREVVRGDVVLLEQGDRVPADAILLSGNDLQADESLLTGESAPVRKTAGGVRSLPAHPGGDDLSQVFSGTMIVAGHGAAEVVATGSATEIGKIGTVVASIVHEATPLRAETRRVVRVLAVVGVLLSLLTMVLFGVMRGSWLKGVLAGITLAMSILPEEFPLVLTIFLVMGAWRISKARVLTRRPATIETLGSATVLCTDKTGTLTINEMSVAELRVRDQTLTISRDTAELPDKFHSLAEVAALASAIEPIDPMDRALRSLATRSLPDFNDRHRGWLLIREYGLTSDLLAISRVWKVPDRTECIVAAKGAPEAIADLCHLDGDALSELRAAVDELAARGIRLLGVACGTANHSPLPDSQHEFSFEYLGLAGLADPLRPGVPDAVRECRAAGVKVVMITGDYPATAAAIAAQAGLDGSAQPVTGQILAKMSEADLRVCVRGTSIFARITPEQKLRIVNAFKADGAIVAMTGDGVNDAPSLKAAHIGIAMGGRGTDTAREAAAIVLLDDDFGSIVRALRLGRRIYDNLRKAMGYLLAVHVPIAGLTILPLLFGLPIVFWPVHIAFLELIVDPVCSIVFEAEVEEGDVMRRKPRDPRRGLFSLALIGWSLFQGFCVFAASTVIFLGAIYRGLPEPDVRALTFVSVVAGNAALIFINRSYGTSLRTALLRPNVTLWLTLGITALLLAAALFIDPMRHLFRFGPLHADDLLVVVAGAALTVGFLEAMKALAKPLALDIGSVKP